MSLILRCNLTLQDCASLWPQSRGFPAFSDRSCVQDVRLGSIGRCGWPGAPCVVSGSFSTCGSGVADVCRGGFCAGAPGDPCTSDFGCIAISCNVSSGTGVCGGAGAEVHNETGIDYGRANCASGSAVQNATSSLGWSCAPGPLLVPSPIPTSTPSANPSTTSSPSIPSANGSRPSTPLGAIIGGTISGLVVFALVAALLLRRRRQRSKNTNYNAPEIDALRHPTPANSDAPTNVYKPDVEDPPSPFTARTADMRESTSHAGAGVITHPPAEPPIPLEQLHTTTSEITEVTRPEPPPTISSGPPASFQYDTPLSPGQLAVVRSLAEQNVPAPTLAALINSLIGEADGGTGQINQPRQASPLQRTAFSPPVPEDPPPRYDLTSP